jgi:SAM-dependent methyltransferase
MKIPRLLRGPILALLTIIDIKKLALLVYIPRYILSWRKFQSATHLPLKLSDMHPCLCDWLPTTPFDPHYFYQAAWLSRAIANAKPIKHVDIGSDIRMIGVLSGFVVTDFLDYRPLPVELSGLSCHSANLICLSNSYESIDSLSCLHVIEHIGLGRYGDPIDPHGHKKAAAELQRVLAPGGRLYISVPIGRDRICFNAHRVFNPSSVKTFFPKLNLESFSFVDDAGVFHQNCLTDDVPETEYGCGMYIFSKKS